jgi:hypothetical protein
MLERRNQVKKERIIMIEGWKFWVVFILLGLMFMLAICGMLAIIIGVVDIWPRIQMIEHGKWRGLP